MKHSKLLDPAHTHPSPPSVFALSCTSQFLLSTSTAPPTIHLTSLALNAPPVLLHPQSSSSTVVAAEFHPERENYFCLAFADGTAAVYDANYFYDCHGNGERRENAAILGTGGEKAFIRGLHVGSMTRNVGTGSGVGVTLEGYDPCTITDQGGIGPRESGISALAFVPGRKATVVTVGADGKCCVVDFTQPTKHKAVLLKSWHIRRPATSLSIICSTKKVAKGQFDGVDDAEPEGGHDLPNGSYYIAVGRSDGRVLLFDLDGKALGEQALDDRSTRVIDVEWTQMGSGAVLPHQNIGSGIRRSPVVKRKRKSLRSAAFVENSPIQTDLPSLSSNEAEHSEDPLFDFNTPRKTLGAFHWEPPANEPIVVAMNPRDGVREGNAVEEVDKVKDSQQKPTHVTMKSSIALVQTKGIESSSQTETEGSSSFRSSTGDDSTPPIPPRPKPRPGGRLSMRRAQTSRQSDIQSTSYLSMMTKARKVSASNPRLPRRVSVASPPTKTKVLFGPRKQPSPKANDSQDNTEASEVLFMSEQPEDAWLNVPPETPRRATEASPVSSATSNKSYRTAVSHLYTSDSPERSDDTVVDWTAGLPRHSVPTLQITHPSGERPSKAKAKRKRHISLSVSSESAGIPTPTPSISAAASPTSQFQAGSPPKLLSSLPSTRSTEPRAKQKPEPEQKGHTSLSVSSASNSDTITPISSGSDGPVIQWPSLKKSPRIPELNKGLSDPRRYAPATASSLKVSISDSATNNILQGYTSPLSPSPPRAANTSGLISSIYPERDAPPHPPPIAAPKPMLVSTVDLERESQHRSCTCSPAVKSILEVSLTTLRAEITQHFEAQKKWFEELLRAEKEGRMMLVEENRCLRDELASVEKEKEKGKSRSGKSNSTRA